MYDTCERMKMGALVSCISLQTTSLVCVVLLWHSFLYVCCDLLLQTLAAANYSLFWCVCLTFGCLLFVVVSSLLVS